MVLATAISHASWNAFIKSRSDRLVGMALIGLGGGILAAVALPFFEIPADPLFWQIMVLSVGVHTFYNYFLSVAYTHGDLGQIYPIARGGGPLIVAIVSVLFLGVAFDVATTVGLAFLIGSIMLLALWSGAAPGTRLKPFIYAAITAALIAAYTLIDAAGARLETGPHVFVMWMCFLDGIMIFLVCVSLRGRAALTAMRTDWGAGLIAGAIALIGYWIVLWAYTQAPVPIVAALRETSVIFAALIGTVFLGERMTPAKAYAAIGVVIGIVLLRV